MAFSSVNPATGEAFASFESWSADQLESALASTAAAAEVWRDTEISQRANLVRKAGVLLQERRDELAGIISREMGKLINEARAEIEKCAWVCEYYAHHGPQFLADEIIETDAGKSYVAYQPLGTVLAIMPWNFPFWQVFRFAAPALVAGNAGLLKHASNVPQCAQAIESVFRDAGIPEGVFRNLLVDTRHIGGVIGDARVHAVTLTGSDKAGRTVAAEAGRNLKKTVLELGGSDPFVVLEDADLDKAARWARKARFQNAGQSCIAAKRFIVIEAIADEFLAKFKKEIQTLKPGDPMDENTTLAPMARRDLRDELHEQVQDALAKGAEAVAGCAPVKGEAFEKGNWYQASILSGVRDGMRAWTEELFGPVAIVIRVKNEAEALKVANGSPFGLGGSVWTGNIKRGEAFARQLECGAAFVNMMVKSDPRLPFGGVKLSGYGRELSHHGIREFVNVKTIYIM